MQSSMFSSLYGPLTDIQGVGDLGVALAGTEFAGIRLQEDASTGHGAGGGSAAAYRLLQQQALAFIKCDNMEPGHWEALQAVGCANLPNEAESGHVTLEEAHRRGIMRFLLTSSGITNTSIHNALVNLLGKPIAECSALCIPTGVYPFPGGPSHAYRFINGTAANSLCALGWKSLGVLELTALPSINEEYWTAAVQETDALLVWGGDPMYLSRWMRESGLADLFPSLRETVYVGVSAGSMLTAPIFGETYDDPTMPFVIDRGLGLVDFALLPHVGHDNHPESSLANAERVAAELPVPMYAIDDDTAIQVTDGTVEVVSEGHWKLFAP